VVPFTVTLIFFIQPPLQQQIVLQQHV